MLGWLQNIVEAVEYIPEYVLYAVETVINLLISAADGLFAVATALIPLPTTPEPPEYITGINWFFPIGTLISIAAPMVTAYITFLGIKWIYKKVGDL